MYKLGKYLTFSCIIIFIILLIIPYFISLNNYKKIIISKVRESTGRDLIIDGDIYFSIFINPSIILHNTKLSSIQDATESYFIEVNEIKATIGFLELLQGKIKIINIEFKKPIINLEILKSGAKNWQISKLTPNDVIEDKNINTNKNIALPFYIEHIKIIDGKLCYIENKNKRIFNNINLDSKIDNIEGPINFILNLNFLDKKFNIEGNIKKLGEIIPITTTVNVLNTQVIVEGKLNSDNSSFIGSTSIKGNTKNFNIIKGLEEDYEFTSSILADNEHIAIDKAKFNMRDLKIDFNGDYNIKTNLVKANLTCNPGNITIALISNNDKSSILNGKIEIESYQIKPLLNILKLQTKTLLPILDQKLQFTSNITYNDQEISLQNINFVTNNTNVQGMIKVKNWSKNISLPYALKINNLDTLMRLLGIKTPIQVSSIQITGETKKINDEFYTNTIINALDSNITLKGNLNFSNTKPKISIDIETPILNINKLVNNIENNANLPNNSQYVTQNNIPWSKDKIDFSFLNSIEVDINATIGKIIKDSFILNSFKTKLNIVDGILNLKSLTANLYDGYLSITGYLQGQKEQKTYWKISLQNANLKNIAPQNGKFRVTQEGQLNLQTDIQSKGNSLYNYISNISGQLNLHSSNGKVSGFNLTKIVNALNNIKNIEGILNTINLSFSGGETTFNSLVSTLLIENGLAKLTECRLDASPAIATATGIINLPQYKLDISSNINIQDLPPFNIKFYGPIDNPQHQLDTKILQAYLIKNVFNTVIDDVKRGNVKPENILKSAIGLKKQKSDNNENEPLNKTNSDKGNTNSINNLLKKNLKGLFN